MEKSKKIRLGTTKKGRNLFISDSVINSTIAVIGSSGGGKTSALNYLAIQKCQAGEDIVVFNVHNVWDVSQLTKAMREFYKERVVSIDAYRDGISLPLMEPLKDSCGKVESDIAVEHRVTSMLKNAGKLSPAETSETADAIKTIIQRGEFAEKGIVALKEFLDMQTRASANHAAGKLLALLEGNVIRSGNFFLNDGKSHIYEINLNGLEYDDQVIIAKFLQDFFLRMAMKKSFIDRGLTLFIDECQNYGFKQGDPLFTLLNEGRKHRISLVLATQSFTMAGKKEMSVILQAGTILYFLPRPDERRAIAKVIDLKEHNKWNYTLAKMKKGEFIACGNFETAEGALVVRPQYMGSCYTLSELEELGFLNNQEEDYEEN